MLSFTREQLTCATVASMQKTNIKNSAALHSIPLPAGESPTFTLPPSDDIVKCSYLLLCPPSQQSGDSFHFIKCAFFLAMVSALIIGHTHKLVMH